MFDRLIETEPEGANFRDGRGYFIVSSIVVGILFITAVVISIYASDYGLGNDAFELSMVVAPPETASPESQPSQPLSHVNQPQQQNLMSDKPAFVAPLDAPNKIPTEVATERNPTIVWNDGLARPEAENAFPNGTGRENVSGTNDVGIANSRAQSEQPAEVELPPTVKKPMDIKPTIIRSSGPINGQATYLPKPPYPAAAIAANIQGKVDVQVMIDESGKIISAKAVNGNALLRGPAEKAAWNAKFDPTYLNKMPVKVTGVIVYNFIR